MFFQRFLKVFKFIPCRCSVIFQCLKIKSVFEVQFNSYLRADSHISLNCKFSAFFFRLDVKLEQYIRFENSDTLTISLHENDRRSSGLSFTIGQFDRFFSNCSFIINLLRFCSAFTNLIHITTVTITATYTMPISKSTKSILLSYGTIESKNSIISFENRFLFVQKKKTSLETKANLFYFE